MRSLVIFWTLAAVLTCTQATNPDPDLNTLSRLFIVHRHGDRTLESTFPNDPYINETYWPDGWGELTMTGKSRMYNIGRFLRTRYDGFLTDNIREANVRSSGTERCLESTQLVLNGMYIPKGRWIWDSTKLWQPFPVHTTHPSQDSMLTPDSDCPAAKQEEENIMKSDYVKNVTQQYQVLLDFLSANCGENVTNLLSAGFVYDALLVEQLNNYTAPDWVNDQLWEHLRFIRDETFYIKYMTRLAQRYRTGVFFNDVQEKIEKAITKSPHQPAKPSLSQSFSNDDWKKVFVYSTHETFTAAALNALDVFNDISPPFGATILFELHQTSGGLSDTNTIRSYYLNETEQLYPLTLPACQYAIDCPVDQFLTGIQDLIITDWQTECQTKSGLVS